MGFIDFGYIDTRASSSVIESGDKRFTKVTGKIRHSLSEDENKARKDFIFNRMKKSMESGRIIFHRDDPNEKNKFKEELVKYVPSLNTLSSEELDFVVDFITSKTEDVLMSNEESSTINKKKSIEIV